MAKSNGRRGTYGKKHQICCGRRISAGFAEIFVPPGIRPSAGAGIPGTERPLCRCALYAVHASVSEFFVKEVPDIPDIPLIYVLNLINTSISYFFTDKSTLLFVHQKKYVETSIRAAVSLAATPDQITALFLTRNYLIYLYIAIGAAVIQNAAMR